MQAGGVMPQKNIKVKADGAGGPFDTLQKETLGKYITSQAKAKNGTKITKAKNGAKVMKAKSGMKKMMGGGKCKNGC